MIGFSIKINSNYALDVYGLYRCRYIKDGLTVFNLSTQSDWYHGDHNPQFSIQLMIFNIMVLDFRIYNIHHVEVDGDNSCSM